VNDDWRSREAIATHIDESSAAIGRKYSRCDNIGIPFAVTIDFQTAKDNTVTVRERDSQLPQIRVKIGELYELIHDLSNGRMKWTKALNSFEHHTQQNTI
jgi:glycyl-tRNA synthetase